MINNVKIGDLISPYDKDNNKVINSIVGYYIGNNINGRYVLLELRRYNEDNNKLEFGEGNKDILSYTNVVKNGILSSSNTKRQLENMKILTGYKNGDMVRVANEGDEEYSEKEYFYIGSYSYNGIYHIVSNPDSNFIYSYPYIKK